MEVVSYIKKYLSAKHNGQKEEAQELKRKMIKGGRGVIAGYTSGRPMLSTIAAAAFYITESREGKEELSDIFRAYYPNTKNKGWIQRIKRDIYYTEFYYQINADEYFRYQFENLSKAGRKKYVGDNELIARFKKMDDPEEKQILADKYNTYCKFTKYYKRDVILVKNKDDYASFLDFCIVHPTFFIKPLSLCSGHGVRKLEIGKEGTAEEIFRTVVEKGPMIVEEPIKQAEEMGKYHHQSINTVRIVTFQKDGKIDIVQSSVRLGMGESVVDNGCLSASVDLENGIITSPGRAAHQKGLYLKHPDTNIQILGSHIPEWERLLAQVREQAKVLKKQRIVGWDMAYSVDGWVIVEANSHPGIQILAGNGIGMRDVFEEITR